MEYAINKGIGAEVEIWGLESQYIFYGAASVLGGFLILILFYLIGIHYIIAILSGILTGTGAVYLTILMNSKFGKYGVTKLLAVKARKEYLKP